MEKYVDLGRARIHTNVNTLDQMHHILALGGIELLREIRDVPDNFASGREVDVYDHEAGRLVPVPLTDADFDQ